MTTNPEPFDIDDILREFGEEVPAEQTPVEEVPAEQIPAEQTPVEEVPAEQIPAEQTPVEEVPVEELLQEEYDVEFSLPQEFFETPEPAIFEDEVDTIRLDDVADLVEPEAASADTQVLPSLDDLPHTEQTDAASLGDTQGIKVSDLGDTQGVKVADLGDTQKIPVQEPKQNRFVLHPQSNPIQQLKLQLTAGPERLYYKMAEKGVGKLAVAILVNFAVFLLCATVTALQAFEVVGETYLRAVIFGQFLAMFISALLGSFQLIDGAADFIRKRFSLNTLLGIAFLVCIADGVLALQSLRVPCCAAFCLIMTFSQLSTYHRRSTLSSRLDTMRKATSLEGTYATIQEDGRKLFVRGEGQVEHFMDHLYTPSLPEKMQGFYALIVLGISLALGVATLFLKDISTGVQVWAVSLLLALPAGSFIAATRPVAILEHRFNKLGTVLCGWQGLQNAKGKADYPVFYEDLFPKGYAKLNGTKFFGELPPDAVVCYATALISATESGLTPLFMTLLENHSGALLSATNLQAYEHGVGGEVEGASVLAGSLSFLRQMGVQADESLYMGHSICVAVNGELSGMFAITYDKNRASASGLQTLCAYSGLRPTIVAADPMLTGSFLHKKLGARVNKLHFPDYPTRQAIRGKAPEEGTTPILLTTKPGLAPRAYGITGARSAYTASMLGTLVQIIGGFVGLAMLAVLVIIGALHLITPVNMFLYQLLWLVPGWLITEWTRTI